MPTKPERKVALVTGAYRHGHAHPLHQHGQN
jgi:hypothetical protein